MGEPYLYYMGDPKCDHVVELSTLTSNPPISEWKCRKCRRTIRQAGEDAGEIRFPDIVKPTFDPAKYPWAKMRLEGDWLYRTDYLYGEDEEIPDEFEVTEEILEAYNRFDWRRVFYEIELGARYNLKNGVVELVSAEGVELVRPVPLK